MPKKWKLKRDRELASQVAPPPAVTAPAVVESVVEAPPPPIVGEKGPDMPWWNDKAKQ